MALENQNDAASLPAASGDSASASPAASTPAVEFTEREQALLSGIDPDGPQPIDDTAASSSAAPAAATTAHTTDQSQPGKDAGTEAASTTDVNAPVGGTEAASANQPPASAAKPWYTDDHKALAQSYGLSDADLAKFTDEADFSKHATFYDRDLATIAAKKLLAQEGQQAAGSQSPPAADASKSGQSGQKPPAPTDDDLDPQKYIDAGYDEETVKLVKFAKAQKDQLAQLQTLVTTIQAERQQAVETERAAAKNRAFHDFVDTLHADRYGKSKDDTGRPQGISEQQDTNRRKIFEAADILLMGIEERAKATGQEPVLPPYAILIKRAEAMVFAEELAREQQEKLRKTMADQSRRRRPVATQRTVPAAKTGDSDVDEVTRLSNIMAPTWETLAAESGAV